jgi:L-rhamnonate dehydratase
MSFPNSQFCEYIANSPDGKSIHPCFGDLFLDEPLPIGGKIDLDETKYGFGMTLNPNAKLVPYNQFFNMNPASSVSNKDQVQPEETH